MRPLPVVAGGTALAAVIARMAAENLSAVAVVDPAGRLVGILTERDVLARVAAVPAPPAGVAEAMTAPVHSVAKDDRLFRAIGFMRRHRLRHMPVVDEDGRPVGLVTLHEALAAISGRLLGDIDQLTHETSLAGLAEVKQAQARLAADLLEEHVPAPEIQALVAQINNDLHGRIMALLLAERGAPPVPFTLIVMGSGGRGESLLGPDQDHGMILDDYPDEAHARIDPWFIELATALEQALARIGFALCKGNVMSSNPVWRKTRTQWRRQTEIWVARRSEQFMLLSDILLDFRAVHGRADWAQELRGWLTDLVRASPRFLERLFAIQADHRAALGLFGRFLTERGDPARRGSIDLKLHGSLPLAEAVRLMALRHGIPAPGTLPRLEALAQAGALDTAEARDLADAFGTITGLQLRAQIADITAGRSPSNHLAPAKLAAREREGLRAALALVNRFRDRLRAEVTGSVL
jgi:signal-transduction protein with cAMP-binding, CBS, and nucleotidyltransferase domain